MAAKRIKIGDILEEKSHSGSSFFVVLNIEEMKGNITFFRINNSKMLLNWNLENVKERLRDQSFNSTASHTYKIHSCKKNKGQNKNEEQ